MSNNQPSRRVFLTGIAGTATTLVAGCTTPSEEADRHRVTTGDALDYTVHESYEWDASTSAHSVEEEVDDATFFLDNKATEDDTHLVHFSATAPQSNYEIRIDSVKYEYGESDITEYNERFATIEATVLETVSDNVGSTVLTDISKTLEIDINPRDDIDYTKLTITDGWGELHTLKTESCSCMAVETP